MSRRGCDEHEERVNMIRCDLVPSLWEAGFPMAGCALAEHVIQVKVGNLVLIPDAIVYPWSQLLDLSAPLLVEIGETDAGKWGYRPWLHIDYDGCTRLINSTGAEFERAVLKCTRELLTASATERVA